MKRGLLMCLVGPILAASLMGCQSTGTLSSSDCAPLDVPQPDRLSFSNTRWVMFNAIDRNRHTWNGSTLEFYREQYTAGTWQLKGYINWHSVNGPLGKERVDGTLDVFTGRLQLMSRRFHGDEFLLTEFDARLCGDLRSIREGRWHGFDVATGRWSARRVIE